MGITLLTLSDIAFVKGGKRLTKGDSLLDEETQHPYIRVSDFNNFGSIDIDNIKFISDETHQKIARYTISDEDLYISIAGTIGKTGIIPKELNGANLTENAAKIVFKDKNRQILRYIYYFTKTDLFIEQIGLATKTVAQPKLALKRLSEVLIPIPEISEQKRIVEKLDELLTRIDTAIEHLQESVVLTDALYVSELSNVFSQGHEKWPLRELNEVAEVARGKSKHRPRNDKSLFGGEYPFIQTGNVRNAQKHIVTYSATYNEKGLQQSKLWPKDTICLTIAANIGDVAILGMDACFPDSVVGISSSQLETDYLYYFLTTLQQQLDSKANASAQKNINLKILSEIKIPVPIRDEQKEVIKKINKIDSLAVKLKAEVKEKITTMKQLKASILNSAFKGEL
jgi:type I restriction enzyme S subunit